MGVASASKDPEGWALAGRLSPLFREEGAASIVQSDEAKVTALAEHSNPSRVPARQRRKGRASLPGEEAGKSQAKCQDPVKEQG